MCIICAILVHVFVSNVWYVCSHVFIKISCIMKNVNKFTVVAILFALFLTNSVLGDNIPTEGKWRDDIIVRQMPHYLQLHQSKEISFPWTLKMLYQT